ncbi:hypothetical protein D3C84_942250 [compost metagenome]
MSDDDHGETVLGQRAHHRKDFSDKLRIESRGRLIEQNDFRVHRQGSGNSHALSLSTRQGPGVGIVLMGQAYLFQQRNGVIVGILSANAHDMNRGLGNILEHREMRPKIEALEHHGGSSAHG